MKYRGRGWYEIRSWRYEMLQNKYRIMVILFSILKYEKGGPRHSHFSLNYSFDNSKKRGWYKLGRWWYKMVRNSYKIMTTNPTSTAKKGRLAYGPHEGRGWRSKIFSLSKRVLRNGCRQSTFKRAHIMTHHTAHSRTWSSAEGSTPMSICTYEMSMRHYRIGPWRVYIIVLNYCEENTLSPRHTQI